MCVFIAVKMTKMTAVLDPLEQGFFLFFHLLKSYSFGHTRFPPDSADIQLTRVHERLKLYVHSVYLWVWTHCNVIIPVKDTQHVLLTGL